MIARPGAGDVQEVTLRGVDVLEVCHVADAFEPRLERDDLVVASGDHHGAELEEWAYVRVYHSEAERSAALGPWLHRYNYHRCHTAIGGHPPISRVNNVPGHYI